MRRVIFAITVTIAGLVALLSFKSHFPERVQATLPGQPPVPGGTAGTTAPFAGAPAPKALPAGERAVLGSVANTIYGPVQIQAVVRSGKIVSVSIVQQPSSTTEDVQIGQYAFPRLIAETLTAQSARVDAVSGATYTSGGYVRSLQSALDRAAVTGGR
jgi:FMN-binding domain